MAEAGDRDRVEGTIDEVKGKAKQAWGDMTDDEQAKVEGMVDEAKGKAQQFLGDLKDAAQDLKEDVDRATT